MFNSNSNVLDYGLLNPALTHRFIHRLEAENPIKPYNTFNSVCPQFLMLQVASMTSWIPHRICL